MGQRRLFFSVSHVVSFSRLSLSSPLGPLRSSKVTTPQLHVTCCLFITQNTCLRLEARMSSGLLRDFQDSYKLIFHFFFSQRTTVHYVVCCQMRDPLRIQNICNFHGDPKTFSVFSHTQSFVNNTRNTERTSVCGAGTFGARGWGGGSGCKG